MTTSACLPRQAFIYNGNLNEKTKPFEDLITRYIELNKGINRDLTLYITSTGGYPEQAFALCDVIRKVQAEGHKVTIHLLGQLCSFNYLLATVADRFVMEATASLTFSQMLVVAKGPLFKLKAHIQEQKEIYAKFVEAVVKRSGGKLDEKTFRSWRGKHLTPQEALALGLCAEVVKLPETPVAKVAGAEHLVVIDGLFSESTMYDRQISLHIWLEDQANKGRPIRVRMCSRGGTVVQALSLYGQLCEALRRDHHVTIEVAGKAYSCALWFTTCALKAGTVEITSDSKLMFHQISVDPLEGTLDVIEQELSVHEGVYKQTCELLCMVPGITQELLKEWEDKNDDFYFSATEAAKLGMGNLIAPNAKSQMVVAEDAIVDSGNAAKAANAEPITTVTSGEDSDNKSLKAAAVTEAELVAVTH